MSLRLKNTVRSLDIAVFRRAKYYIPVKDFLYILGDQFHPMIQLFPNNDANFQDASAPIHTPATVK